MDTNPMHKRLANWDYHSRCNYMVTLVTEPRTPRFGSCEEWGINRSEDARAVYDAWQSISAKFPQVQASYYCIMPDHFHGILYVKEPTPFHLDEVVAYFRTETERRLGGKVWEEGYQDSVCLQKGQLHRMINYLLDNPRRAWIKKQNPGMFRKYWHLEHPRLPALGQKAHDKKNTATPFALSEPPLILPRRGNTGTALFRDGAAGDSFLSCAFCCSLPGWSLVAPGLWRATPGTLPADAATDTVRTTTEWTALGNLFLLERPLLAALRLSRSTPPTELEKLTAQALAKAERGAVIVSPFFSPAEQEIKHAVAAAGGSLIELGANGFSSLQKPSGTDFELCSEGRLLQLSAFPYEPGRGTLNKPKCEWMNSAARAMADMFLGWPKFAK